MLALSASNNAVTVSRNPINARTSARCAADTASGTGPAALTVTIRPPCTAKHPSIPPVLIDPEMGENFVLLREDIFEMLKGMAANEVFDPNEFLPATAEAFAEHWDDPAMDIYDQMASEPADEKK